MTPFDIFTCNRMFCLNRAERQIKQYKKRGTPLNVNYVMNHDNKNETLKCQFCGRNKLTNKS